MILRFKGLDRQREQGKQGSRGAGGEKNKAYPNSIEIHPNLKWREIIRDSYFFNR